MGPYPTDKTEKAYNGSDTAKAVAKGIAMPLSLDLLLNQNFGTDV
jgi:hypothetical protein